MLLTGASDRTVGRRNIGAFLIQNEHDARVTQFGFFACGTTSFFHDIGSFVVVIAVNGFESLPQTRIVDIVEYVVCVFGRTATLEVHTADVLTALHITTCEIRELRVEVVVRTVAVTTRRRTFVVRNGHQNLFRFFGSAVRSRPVSVKIVIVCFERTVGHYLVAELDSQIEVGFFRVFAVPVGATLALTIEQGFGVEVSGRVLRPCVVYPIVVGRDQFVGMFEVIDDLVEYLFLRCPLVVAFHLTAYYLGRFGLQNDAAVLSEQTQIVVTAQEISLAQSTIVDRCRHYVLA